MRFIRFALAIACSVAACAIAMPVATPLASRAQLDAYLRETPPGQSPLDALPPEAKKRFLASLQFNERGAFLFSTDDLGADLTTAQIVPILQLFGLADYARAIRAQPRALPPPCTDITRCPPSTIDKAYTALQDPTHDGDGAFAARFYEATFAPYQLPARLTGIANDDLRLLFRAAHWAAGLNETNTPQPHITADMQRDLDELHRRGLDRDDDWQAMYDLDIADRQFDRARELVARHASLPPVPPLTDDAQDAGSPSMLSVEASGNLHRETFDAHDGATRIVVMAGCHLAADAASHIDADATLGPVFRQHAVWLGSQLESFDDVRAWNSTHPQQPMHVAWRNHEWTQLDYQRWPMPTFYVFRDGRLLGKVTGYQPDPLRKLLAQAGLVH